MELSIKSLILFGAVFLTGLSAGFFYAWLVSVIPGTQKVINSTYLETMQSINRAILNPAFFIIFFGTLIFLSLGSIYQYNVGKTSFWFMLLATLIYMIGTLGITAFGNVPLNNQLDKLNLSELSSNKLTEFRNVYESKWNRLHLFRTIFAIVSFILATLSIFAGTKNI